MKKQKLDIPEEVNALILKYYPQKSISYYYYYTHCLQVTELALKIAKKNKHLSLNTDYLIKAGMLHDIGICKTNAPEIGCFGDLPYITHTYLGREILEQNGFDSIAPICERHIGVGLSREDIISSGFPLPHRDMLPIFMEEKLICFADKFYSKNEKHLTEPKSLEKIRKKVGKYGKEKAGKFEELLTLFGNPIK